MTITIISRDQWGARQPKSRSLISLPSPELWLHHSADSNTGAAGMRNIQRQHQAKWSDIGYSYVIDGDTLEVFEGRGAGVLGAHTFGRNSRSHGICVLGNFEIETPSPQLLDKIAELIEHGHRNGWWPASLTGGHRDVVSTACPGRKLYVRIGDVNSRTGGVSTMPAPTEPDPYVQRVQQALMAAGFELPEFGADGFAGAETAAAAEQVPVRLAELQQTIKTHVTAGEQLSAQLAEAQKLAEAGELIRQGIIKLAP